MDDRSKNLIDKITNELIEQGIKSNKIRSRNKSGYGDFQSFFDLAIELKLEGRTIIDLTSKDVWEDMKAQLNYYQAALIKLDEEYQKVLKKCRNQELDAKELCIEKRIKEV
jgi:Leu/Phe-tRNA-protein transferase